MNAMLIWFAPSGTDAETTLLDEVEENRLEPGDLPAHVQEFLAMKAAAGV